MKKLVFAIIATAIILLLCALTLLHPPDAEVVGVLKIPAHDIRTVIMTAHGETCGCCTILWNGGIVHAMADLSPVQVGDMADIITLDGGYYVLECMEIIPALHIGRWLVSWRGVVKADGDVIVFSAGKAYRFGRL